MMRLGADALIADISFAAPIPKDVEESESRQDKRMNKLYWIVRYRAKGKRRPKPVLTSLRHTKYDSIRAAVEWAQEDWSEMKVRLDLECVKVRILDPAPQFRVSA